MGSNIEVNDFLYNHKQEVKIGILAKRGKIETYKRWDPLVEYLNKKIEFYNFVIVPLDFNELQENVKNKTIDFVITNSMYYVVLENRYGVSRIATLLNSDNIHNYMLKEFGGVIFTRKDNNSINSIEDIDSKSFGAVSELSFGGWIMGYEELRKHGINKKDIDLAFLGTHDNVVKAVLASEVDAGVVRTDTLEKMILEKKINLSDIKVLGVKKYKDFPYLVSTNLYPEWPIAKLRSTPDELANKILAELITYVQSNKELKCDSLCWTVPLDYTSVHNMLKELRLPPYEDIKIKFEDVVKEYAIALNLGGIFLLLLIARLIYEHQYNKKLDKAVNDKTKDLIVANDKLKLLANRDYLTGISNRAHFMKFAKKYFEMAKRNGGELQILSLDIDYFKSVNDRYGHDVGDCVLKDFSEKISLLLRKSDLFGRIGGEEFCILLQNTSQDGAVKFGERIRMAIKSMDSLCSGNTVNITVSIGVASLHTEKNVEDLIKKSDIALYDAKKNGRDQISVYSQD